MPLVGPWTDSTGTGHTYPNAWLVAHERIDTRQQLVMIDVTIWASSAQTGRHPLYQKTLAPTSGQIDTIVALVEGRADLALQSRAPFAAMSTAA